MEEQVNKTKGLKLHSQRAIGIATLIGGPMAAGYLIRENYRSLEKSDNGKIALSIGIVTTILLFIGIFSIPESIMENVPNQTFPAIYTGIVYLIVEKIHGTILNQHKEYDNEFYSGWKAAGIGVIALLIMLSGIFGYAYLSTDNELYEKYDNEMQIFSLNENESLKIYEELDSKSRFALTNRIEEFTIPKWEENITIVKRTNAYGDLPEELQTQNEILLEYSELRIESFKLLKRAIEEDTDKYGFELDKIHDKIDEALERLN